MLSKKLRYFIVAMETCCIATAAEQLCITRSPLGRVLYELESHLGGKLFDRKYNHLHPTEMAKTLYDRLRPVYDILCSIEHEFNPSVNITCLELLFDISIPYSLFQSLSSAFRSKHLPVKCRRISAAGTDVLSLSDNSGVMLFTHRKILTKDNISCLHLKKENLILCLPSDISDHDFNNIDIIKKIPLYIRKDDFFDERKGIVEYIMKNTFSFVDVQQTEDDLSSLMLMAGAGKCMFLLPEFLAEMLNHTNVRKYTVPGIKLDNIIYINEKIKDSKLINEIIDLIKMYVFS